MSFSVRMVRQVFVFTLLCIFLVIQWKTFQTYREIDDDKPETPNPQGVYLVDANERAMLANKTTREILLSMMNVSRSQCLNTAADLKLMMIHIPKTGGTAISKAAWDPYRICWGEHVQRLFGHAKSSSISLYARKICKSLKICGERNNDASSIWHMPMRYVINYMHENDGSGEESEKMALYFDRQKYDYFCVVRHPFSRIISEYQYSIAWSWKHIEKYGWKALFGRPRAGDDGEWPVDARWCSSEALNFWVQRFLIQAREHSKCVADCHWVPQYEYVFDWNGERVCDHVIHYENLQQELNRVMHEYGLGDLLDLSHRILPYENEKDKRKQCKHITVHNLTQQTRELIHEFYKRDFDTFQYSVSVV